MKEIAKKCPKGWKLFDRYMVDKYGWAVHVDDIYWITLYGYLVLEFFPKYGIEIERYAVDDADGHTVDHSVWYDNDSEAFNTAKDTIVEAFEILEKQLEEK